MTTLLAFSLYILLIGYSKRDITVNNFTLQPKNSPKFYKM